MARRKHSLLDLQREVRRRRGRSSPASKAYRASSLFRLQDQIDAVSGRKRPPTSSALQHLEERGKRVIVTARSYDVNAPIKLYYNRAGSGQRPGAPQARTWDGSLAFPQSGETGIGPYTVESFEDTLLAPPRQPPEVLPGSPAIDLAPPLVSPEPSGRRAEPEPEPGHPHSARAPWAPREDRPAPDQPPAERDSKPPLLISTLAADAEDFEADILSILAGQADQAPSPATPPPPARAGAPGGPGSQDNAETAGEDPHAIFDQMGHNMRYANTFDLGTVEIDRRFDAFEHELDREESLQPARAVAPLSLPSELDDLDLLADIVEIGESGTAGGDAQTTPGAQGRGDGAERQPSAAGLPQLTPGADRPRAGDSPAQDDAIAALEPTSEESPTHTCDAPLDRVAAKTPEEVRHDE